MGFFTSISFSKPFSIFLILAYAIPACLNASTQDSSFVQHPECIQDHFSALLRLKRGFLLDFRYANLSSWNPVNRDCCTWEGITCDSATGHVTGLDLTQFHISGQIDFQILSHLRSLQILNLAYNDFAPSPIPSAIGQLNRLTRLDLSSCNFYGQIPLEMSSLTRLVSLDLSSNGYYDKDYGFVTLKLEKPNIGALIQNLSRLRDLSLDYVNMSKGGSEWSEAISSALPNLRGNLSSLTSLSLKGCGLHGGFFKKVFRLPYLSKLDLSFNNFSSDKLDIIGNFSSFKFFTHLTLRSCSMSGPLPSQLGNLTKLKYLELSYNSFDGAIPSSLFSLPSLQSLNLEGNQLGGQLGEFLNASLSQLEFISLFDNRLQGTIPRSLFQLKNLKVIFLHSNSFSDALDLGLFMNLTKLSRLGLSNIDLSFPDSSSNLTSISFLQLSALHLRSCNIKRFPDFLRNQEKLLYLDLSGNKLGGEIPMWIWKVGNGRLRHLNLSHNALQAIETPIPHPSFAGLYFLDLSSNLLKGSLPVPSFDLQLYLVSNNSLRGEIPMSICNLTALQVLDMSGNNFSGHVPQCFGKPSRLTVLNLRGNSFNGSLSQTFTRYCNLQILDLSENQLEGQLPNSLANCTRLKVLELRNNQMHDTFPLWIKDLADLRVLILKSNNFYGPIELPSTVQNFSSNLQVIDLSFNSFNGHLPSAMFSGWKEMAREDNSELEYLKIRIQAGYIITELPSYYEAIIIRSKSLEMHLQKIPTAFTLVDLSSNYFQGQIRNSLGTLKSLHVLNMSHNGFTGQIPTSLKNLKMLESLDLSRNNISGHIPQELGELTFLAVLNLSENQLTGHIPNAKQFLTFSNESFQGNPGLCGPPLSKACEETNGAQPSGYEDPELLSDGEYDWKIIAIGFGVGYGVGIGVFFWTLVLWEKGRRVFNYYVYRMLVKIFPSIM